MPTPYPLSVCLVLALCSPCRAENEVSVSSPSGNHVIQFSLLDGVPHYDVSYRGAPILAPSALSLEFDGDEFNGALVVDRRESRLQNSSWVPVTGSKSSYPDSFQEIVIQLRESSGKKRRLDLIFRAYDEGVAFRYSIPKQEGIGKLKLNAENTQFQFTDDHFVYWDDYPQAKYSKVRISEMPGRSIRPLLVEAGSHFVAIAEAGSLEDYAPMMLNRSGKNRLVTWFRSGTVSADKTLKTPWRVCLLYTSPSPRDS